MHRRDQAYSLNQPCLLCLREPGPASWRLPHLRDLASWTADHLVPHLCEACERWTWTSHGCFLSCAFCGLPWPPFHVGTLPWRTLSFLPEEWVCPLLIHSNEPGFAQDEGHARPTSFVNVVWLLVISWHSQYSHRHDRLCCGVRLRWWHHRSRRLWWDCRKTLAD